MTFIATALAATAIAIRVVTITMRVNTFFPSSFFWYVRNRRAD